jgi:hypothetical protein
MTRDELLGTLRLVEWGNDEGEYGESCPMCKGLKPDPFWGQATVGHESGCAFSKAIEWLEDEDNITTFTTDGVRGKAGWVLR